MRRPTLPKLEALVTAPAGPFVGAWLSYQVNHPPRLSPSRKPTASGLTPHELAIPSGNGKLDAWLFSGDPSRVVVLGHSIGAEKSRSLSYAIFLVEAGYTVLLFDFRNHGKSFTDRSFSGYSRRFADDLVAAVRHVRAMPEHEGAHCALYGLSMSSFAVVHSLGRLEGIDAAICDSGPTAHPAQAIRNLLRIGMLPIPAPMRSWPALNLLEFVFRPLTALSMSPPRPWPPSPKAPEYSVPILFVVGDRDTVVSADEVREMAESFPNGKVLLVPGAGHLRSLSADRDLYRATVLEFLARHLGKPESGLRCASD